MGLNKTTPPLFRRPAWLALRSALALSVAALAFFDGHGLGWLLTPGQAVAAAFAPGPHPPDPRFGVSLGLALWAGLALASVAARAIHREPRS